MKENALHRRKFFALIGAGTAALAVKPSAIMASAPVSVKMGKPATNIADAAKTPRNEWSMPGMFPGKVIQVTNPNAIVNNEPVEKEAYKMIEKAMMELTEEDHIKKAWRHFVKPGEKIGLKVNPIGGRLLSTSHAVTQSVIRQLLEAGIEKENIIIWDRRMMDLIEAGYTANRYPGIKIMATELQDEKGSFYDASGKLYGENNIDKDWYYWADIEGSYDKETLPYMINDGKYSYFTKIITQELDKVINMPILKNAGASITNAMKNLGYGVITNTGRLHAQLWNETSAEVCAFAPVRDKVVLNICDALRGCFNGGPAANPQFICNFNAVLVATDPVALDRIGYDIVAEKRVKEGIQKSPTPEVLKFLEQSEELGLGIFDKSKIKLRICDLG